LKQLHVEVWALDREVAEEVAEEDSEEAREMNVRKREYLQHQTKIRTAIGSEKMNVTVSETGNGICAILDEEHHVCRGKW